MYDIFEELLKEKGVNATEVSRATGIPRSMFTDWKKGRSAPKADKIKKIAEYFDVPVSVFYDKDRAELLTEKSMLTFISQREQELLDAIRHHRKIQESRLLDIKKEYYNPETYEMAQAIFDRPDLHALMKAAMDCEPDQIQSVADMLTRFKETNIDG